VLLNKEADRTFSRPTLVKCSVTHSAVLDLPKYVDVSIMLHLMVSFSMVSWTLCYRPAVKLTGQETKYLTSILV